LFSFDLFFVIAPMNGKFVQICNQEHQDQKKEPATENNLIKEFGILIGK